MLSNRISIDSRTLWGISIVVLAVLSGLAILVSSPLPILPLSGILLVYLILRKPLASVVLLVIIAFFGTGLSQMGVIPDEVNWLTEVLIAGLFIRMIIEKALAGKRIYFFGWPIVGAFLFIVLLSAMLNNVSPVSTILFLRLIFRFYILMVVLVNMEYKEEVMLKINKLLAWLFIIQIPTAIVKFFIYGQGEQAIGTYAMWGGGASTSMPLIAMGFIAPFYFIYKKNPAYLFLALGFVLFSVIGGKRAFVFFLAIVLLFLTWFLRKHIKHYFSYLLSAMLGLLIVFYLIARLVPTLNPEREVWGAFSTEHVISYLKEYETAEIKGKAIGHTGATKNIFTYLAGKGIEKTLLGEGPGTFIKSMFESFDTRYTKREDETDVGYGMTGLNWLALQSGYLGASLWLCFYIFALVKVANYYNKDSDKYWRAYHLGVLSYAFVVLLISLTYDIILLSDDTFSFAFMIFLAFSIKRAMLNQQAAPNLAINKTIISQRPTRG